MAQKVETFGIVIGRVMGAIRGCAPVDAEAITHRILAAQARGENSAVWHHSAAHYGHRCHCFPCERSRAALAAEG